MTPNEVIGRMQRNLARLGNTAKLRQIELVQSAIRAEARRLRASHARTWTRASSRATMMQLRLALARLSADMGATLSADMKAAAKAAHKDAAAFLRASDRAYTGSVRPLRFEAVDFLEAPATVAGQARIANYQRSLARYGGELTREVERAAARAAMLGMSWHEAADEVAATLRAQAGLRDWEVRRVVETEVSAAYNQMQLDALIAEDDPQDRMLKRLVAHFDSRTGRDSVLLHGQVRPVREAFFDAHNGRYFMAPPNRPHDRELLVGQRESWPEAAIREVPEPEPKQPVAAHPRLRARSAVRRIAGQAVRRARNVRPGDVLAMPGRPRIAEVTETRGMVAMKTDRGLLLYFAAGMAIGVLVSS